MQTQLPPLVSDRYFLYDHACQTDAQPTSTNAPTHIYLTDFEQPLALNNSQQLLSTSLIDTTFYGETYQRQCYFYHEQGHYCLDTNLHPAPWKKISKSGGKLRICDTEQNYPQESYEHVALVTAMHLHKAQRFLQRSAAQDMPPMSLLILPFFRTLYKDKDGRPQQRLNYRNIIYFPASKSLAVLPDRDNFSGRGLWESSFIIAHELAHHMQFAARPKRQTTLAASMDEGESRRAVPPDIAKRSLEAFLEGWADLFAFYAEHENSAEIVAYRCFGYNRNVANPMFADHTYKAISAAALAVFYAGERGVPSCTRPDFSDTHIIGAVLAYHLHRIVSYVLDSGWLAASSPATKYRYLHGWLTTTFDQVQKDSDNDQNMLRTIITTLFQAIKHDLNQRLRDASQHVWLTAQVCTMLEEGLPTLSQCRESS